MWDRRRRRCGVGVVSGRWRCGAGRDCGAGLTLEGGMEDVYGWCVWVVCKSGGGGE